MTAYSKRHRTHLLTLIHALDVEKTLQIENVNHDWIDLLPDDDIPVLYRIRVKPEIIEAWANVYEGGIRAYKTKEEAERYVRHGAVFTALHMVQKT